MISLPLALLALLLLPASRIQPISIATLFLLFSATLPMLTEDAMNTWFFYDGLSSPLILLTLWIGALSMLASTIVSKPHLFSNTVSLLTLALVVVFLTRSLFHFYISFEIALLPTFFLILTWGYQPERLQAAIYLVAYTVFASLPLLIGTFLLHYNVGAASFTYPWWSPPVAPIIWWLIMNTAFLVNIPMYSFHLWLPNAHVEAPVAGSIILAGILLNLGGYGILRVAQHIQHHTFFAFITSLSLFGGLICAIICLRQTDLNALIAYSSVTHMAIVIAAILSNTPWGWQGALTAMIAHGLISSALFALCNSAYLVTNTRSLFLTKGLISFSPLITLMWFIALAGNIGAPPSINLQSEIIMTTGILHASNTLTVPVALILFFSAAYCLHVHTATQHGGLSPNTTSLLPVPHQTALCIFLHVFPAFVLILNTDVCTL